MIEHTSSNNYQEIRDAIRPTFDLHPFTVLGQPQDDGKTVKLWAHDHEGSLTMQGTATIRA